MKTFAKLAVAVLIGVLVGRYTHRPAKIPPLNFGEEVTVLRANRPGDTGVPTTFKPVGARVDDTVTRWGEAPEDDSWIVKLAGGRVIIYATTR